MVPVSEQTVADPAFASILPDPVLPDCSGQAVDGVLWLITCPSGEQSHLPVEAQRYAASLSYRPYVGVSFLQLSL
jgi:hypothetical protein